MALEIEYNELSQQDYLEQLFDFIVEHEADRRSPYLDTHANTYVTIGYGFNVETNPDIRNAVYSELGFRAFFENRDQFSEVVQAREEYYIGQLNIALNSGNTDEATITTLNNLMAQRAADPVYENSGVDLSKTSFSFSEGQAGLDEMERVFAIASEQFEQQITDVLGDVPLSTERIVYFSMAYNGLLEQSPSFQQAIEDGNRARAYYELRFDSNPNRILGVHNRRIAESDLFGLYNDPDNITDDEAKNVVRFLEQHRENIINNYLPNIIRLLSDGTTQPAPQAETFFTEPLQPAIDLLVTHYGQGCDIQKIVVGDDPNTGEARDDSLNGGVESDLIFGEAGNDTLNGAGGNDALYGGSGNDTVNGGLGNDYLFGESGHDVLNGGDGADILVGGAGGDILNGGAGDDFLSGANGINLVSISEDDHEQDRLVGGEGNDTFRIHAGDIIEDNDGTIYFNEELLTFNGKQVATDSEYYLDEASGATIRKMDDGLEYYGPDGANFRIVGEFASGAFGITLNAFEAPETIAPVLIGTDFTDYVSLDIGENSEGIDPDDPFSINNIKLRGEPAISLGKGQDHFQTISGSLAYAVQVDGGDDNDLLVGGSADDRLYGGSGSDVIFGMVGNDSIQGGTEADALSGEEGDDYIEGGGGENIIAGGAGNDKLFGGEDADLILGDQTIDVFIGTDDHVVLPWGYSATQSQLPNQISYNNGYQLTGNIVQELQSSPGASYDDTLYGGQGEDLLFGQLGNDKLYGGADQDFLKGEHGDDWLYGEDGDDFLMGDSSPSNFPDHDPTMIGDDHLYGGAGQDLLQGGLGNDFLYGGDDRDGLFGEEGNDFLYGENQNDVLQGGIGDDVLDGGYGSDQLSGDAGNDKLNGGFDDPLNNAGDIDTLQGGEGDDEYRFGYGYGSDLIVDSEGADKIVFNADVLPGVFGEGNLSGGSVRFGRSGNDLFVLLDGSTDQLVVSNWFTPEGRIESFEFANDVTWSALDVLAFFSESTNEEMNIPPALPVDNILVGSNDNEVVAESAISQMYYLFGGDDTVAGGEGHDVAYGGTGNDTASGQGNDDQLYGDAGDDWLSGDAGNDYLNGGQDSDQLLGGEGDDILYGGTGIDMLQGGGDDDFLDGGGGDDELSGGVGNDFLGDVQGNDRYLFDAGWGTDAINDTDGVDEIVFGEGISADEIRFIRSPSNDLYLVQGDTDNRIIFNNWFGDENARIERISFADGTVLKSSIKVDEYWSIEESRIQEPEFRMAA